MALSTRYPGYAPFPNRRFGEVDVITVRKEPSTIKRVAAAVFGVYTVVSVLVMTVLLVLWKFWIFKIAIGCNTDNASMGTRRTKGFFAVVGGARPLVGPPSRILRIGRAVDTPIMYDVRNSEEMAKKHGFFAYSNRSNQEVSGGSYGGRFYFIGDPRENGKTGLAPFNYKLLQLVALVPGGGGTPIPPETPMQPIETIGSPDNTPTPPQPSPEAFRSGLSNLRRMMPTLT